MSRGIVITTGARLHFGLLSHRLEAGRNFGGAGLMVDAPRYRLSARRAEHDAVVASAQCKERIERFVVAYRAACPAELLPPSCEIELLEEIPPHAGFGSGTQLGLAVAQALALLAGDGQADAVTLAGRVGRGARSALGIHGFARGGFLIDGGKSTPDAIGTLSARADFPAAWRMVLVTPESRAGLAGAAEVDAFQRLPGMSQKTTDRLCRIALGELLPAVLEADFDACGEALYEFGRLVGEYFAPVQGGVYADRSMETLVAQLRRRGIRGVGQTSWGPTLFALCPGAAEAESLAADLRGAGDWNDCRIRVVAPLNSGAAIEVGRSSHDEARLAERWNEPA